MQGGASQVLDFGARLPESRLDYFRAPGPLNVRKFGSLAAMLNLFLTGFWKPDRFNGFQTRVLGFNLG